MGRLRNPEREVRILQLLIEGKSVNEVAETVGVHRNTVGALRSKALACQDAGGGCERMLAEVMQKKEEIVRAQEVLRATEKQIRGRILHITYIQAAEKLIEFIVKSQTATKNSVWATASMDQQLADGFSRHDVVCSTSCDPARIAERNEIARVIAEAMQKLNEAHRLVVEELFWAKRTLKEASESLGMTEGDVLTLRDEAIEILGQTDGLKALAG